MEHKVYELVIDDKEQSGVDYVAIVDAPAIESDFLAFNETKQSFKIDDEEKRIISGYLMLADKPIYRNNEQLGEHYVVFKADTIRDIVFKFMKNGFNSNTNLQHEEELRLSDVFLFESILIDSKRGMKAPKGFEDAPDGSWFGSMRVDNDKVWSMIKENRFKGFSVEGWFSYVEPNKESEAEQKLRKVLELLSELEA